MTNKLSFPRGSEWRKWDLHFHTPSSFDYGYKGATNKEIVDTLIKNEISVVAITDHHTIDIKRIEDLRKIAQDKIVFLPGIELRTELGGSDSIHMIGIFPEDCDIDSIWLELQAGCKLKPSDIKENGDDKIYVDFKETSSLIHKLGGVVTAHAGSKSNTLENITNSLPHKTAQKTDLVIGYIDFFELGQEKDQEDYKNIVFPSIKKYVPMIMCSDNHDCRNYKLKQNNWIKADLTFQGLIKVIYEPISRVFIGNTPQKLIEVANNKSKYISTVEVTHINSGTTPSWFSNKIELNTGLVAIIGRKGSGKSALADIISLCGDSKIDPKDYSFLTNQKFRKRRLAKDYKSTIEWQDGKKAQKILDSDVDIATSVERVKYLPQQYVETICNEEGVSILFQQEIDKVIFSYVPEENKLGANNLSELISTKTESVNTSINELHNELNKINTRIIANEEKELPSYSSSLQKKLEAKEQELKNLPQPVAVKKPSTTPSKAIESKIKRLTTNISHIDSQIEITRQELKNTNEKLHKLGKIQSKATSINDNIIEFIENFKDDAVEIGIDITKIITLKFNDKSLQIREKELSLLFGELEKKLEKDCPDSKTSLYTKKLVMEKELGEITIHLDADQQQYKKYLGEIKEYENKQKLIKGITGDKTLDTITSIKEELTFVENELATVLQDEYKKRKGILVKILTELGQKIKFYEDIYKPIVKFIDSEKETQKKTGNILSFDVGLNFEKQEFCDNFLSFINQGKDGSFQTIVGGQKVLTSIIEKYDFTKEKGICDFIEDVMDHLNHDKTSKPEKVNHIDSQLKKDKKDFYNFIFNLNYLQVKYKILFNGKELNANEFSPGEKGALLLIFYLLIDKDNTPLIIDQPEENLDNESVYTLLVPYIKKAKEKRQIITVTHNPNLAVVCDAEQIIYTAMDKKKNEIRYTSGSIEDREINKKIVDVLEGTLPAFTKRDRSYIRR